MTHDAVGDVGDDADVVGDDDDTDLALAAKRFDEVEDLGLDRDIRAAVVGSSAMISSGSPASASAMTTRWRIPPENWWG